MPVFRIVGSVALALMALLPAPLEAKKPRAAAFVVGIANYDRQEFNKLKAPANDADAVYAMLQDVTDLQTARSRLILIDDAPSAPGAAASPRQSRLTSGQLDQQFREFLDGLQNGDLVLVYLGGHGQREGSSLRFLTSEYQPGKSQGYLSFVTILELISGREQALKAELPSRKLDLPIVILANMCNSGAGGLTIEAALAEAIIRQGTMSASRLAFVPAAAADANAYEMDGRSHYARHLLAALEGPGNAQREVTAGGLLTQLQSFSPDIPEHSNFKHDIVLADASEPIAWLHYALGTGHLALHERTGDTRYRDLARAHYRESARAGGSLQTRSSLRYIQLSAASERPISEWLPELNKVIRRDDLKPAEKTAAEALLTSVSTPPVAPPLRSVADLGHYLESKLPTVPLILTDQPPFDEGVEIWQRLIAGYGYRTAVLTTSSFDDPDALKSKFLEAIPGLYEAARQVSATPEPLLLLIYTGRAFNMGGQLVPFGQSMLRFVSERWWGPVVIVYTAPFAGYLVQTSPPANFSLLLAGLEPNAMTFTGEGGLVSRDVLRESWDTLPDGIVSSTDLLLARAIKEKVANLEEWPALARYVDVTRGILAHIPRTQTFSIGLPRWVTGPPAPQRVLSAQEQLHPEAWFAALAAGCYPALEPPCSVEPAKPLTELAAAVASEQAGNREAAQVAYARFLDFARAPPSATALAGPLRRTENSVRGALAPLVKLVERRLARLKAEESPTPQLRFVPVVVENYRSRLVADLPGAAADAQLWRRTLMATFRGNTLDQGSAVARTESVAPPLDEVPPPGLTLLPPLQDPKSAADIREHLTKALAEAKPGELVFFFFSGRGVHQGGRFHLATAGVEARAELEDGGRVSWDEAGLLSLDEVAALADGYKDRWLVALYDAQFTPPFFQEGRSDALLDKHLDSVRPNSAGTIPAAGIRLRVLPDPDDLPRQVHLWFEGRLTQGGGLAAGCPRFAFKDGEASLLSDDEASPLSRALLLVGPAQHRSYRDWAEAALRSPCLTDASGWLVVQGESSLPALATSYDAEELAFLGTQAPRIVPAAFLLSLAGSEALANSPLLTLSRAAVAVSTREGAFGLPASMKVHDVIPRWARTTDSGEDRLAELRQFAPKEEDLPPGTNKFAWDVLDLQIRLLRSLRRNQEALQILHEEAAQPHLHQRSLLEQFIILLEEVQRSTENDEELIKAVPKVEAALETAGNPSDMRDRWRQLLERERQVRPFRIRLDAVGYRQKR